MSEASHQVIFPGDKVAIDEDVNTSLGQGLIQHRGGGVASTKCGILIRDEIRSRNKPVLQSLHVINIQKRYIPHGEDMVIGVVLSKHSENYKLDIGGPSSARLPILAFEGATKRNKPNIKEGALMYCRVAACNKHIETELTCISPHVKKEWVTGESIFGELLGGYAFDVSLSLAQALLDEDCWVLKCVARHVPFEVAVGANGKVWLNAASPLIVILVSNAILNSEHMDRRQTDNMVTKLMSTLKNS